MEPMCRCGHTWAEHVYPELNPLHNTCGRCECDQYVSPFNKLAK